MARRVPRQVHQCRSFAEPSHLKRDHCCVELCAARARCSEYFRANADEAEIGHRLCRKRQSAHVRIAALRRAWTIAVPIGVRARVSERTEEKRAPALRAQANHRRDIVHSLAREQWRTGARSKPTSERAHRIPCRGNPREHRRGRRRVRSLPEADAYPAVWIPVTLCSRLRARRGSTQQQC